MPTGNNKIRTRKESKGGNKVKLRNKVILGFVAMLVVGYIVVADILGPSVVSVESGTKNRLIGETFNLNVTIDPMGQPMSGVQMNVLYNASLIRINSVTEGNLLTQDGWRSYFSDGTGLIDETYNVSFDNNVTFYNGTNYQTPGLVKNIFGVILGPHNISIPGTFIVLNVTIIGASVNGTSQFISTAISLDNVLIADLNATPVWLTAINGTAKIRVPSVVTTIMLSPVNPTMATGSTISTSAMCLDQTGAPVLPCGVINYSTSNNSILTVNQTTGKITAKNIAGTAYLYAVSGAANGSMLVTIEVPRVTVITVSPVGKIINVSQVQSFSSMCLSQFAAPIIPCAVNWTSVNSVIANVSAAGKATGQSSGMTNITASFGNISGSQLLTVR